MRLLSILVGGVCAVFSMFGVFFAMLALVALVMAANIGLGGLILPTLAVLTAAGIFVAYVWGTVGIAVFQLDGHIR